MKRRRRSRSSPTVATPEPPVQAETNYILSIHPEVEALVDRCVEQCLAYRMHLHDRGPKPEVSPFEEVTLFCKRKNLPLHNWSQILHYIVMIARTRPQWNGIKDPVKEQKCVICRKVKPIESFDGSLTCEHCRKE